MWFLRPPFAKPRDPIHARDVVRGLEASPGAYVHVPYCTTACPFCPYNTVPFEAEGAGRYFEALAREARAYRDALKTPFTSLYVGGGTPTLCIDALEDIVGLLNVRGERAIEVLPTHASLSNLERLRDLGFSHLSLGIQSFDGGVLRHLQRPGSPELNRAAVGRARGLFDCVDVDLIFDTAFADIPTFLRDVETCLRFGVEQVSAYPLMRFGITPFGKAPHRPGVEHEALARATDLATRHGYVRGSVWTFHRPGGPTYSSITRPVFVGLGAGAATFTGRRFLVNHFSPKRYAADLEAGHLPVARELPLPRWHAAAYAAFWRLYTGTVEHAPGRRLDPGRILTGLLSLGVLTGHLRRRGRTLRLTRRGYDAYHDLERWVTYRYIEPLWEELIRERDAGPTSSATVSA